MRAGLDAACRAFLECDFAIISSPYAAASPSAENEQEVKTTNETDAAGKITPIPNPSKAPTHARMIMRSRSIRHHLVDAKHVMATGSRRQHVQT
ncbi:hypothetical protein CKO51_11410 [Rhodopirellula sp. SM50]|nr:hypothetical protein CKO51_11410 [Rhodopirellula sp. SM50]